jgi:predicted ATP-dependent serine protease
MTEKPWIVLVGGFLGAGKTTLLLAAARELERRGLRSALILNDQGEALVDTEFADLHGFQSGEVKGGCFCCRFSDLLEVIDRLREHSPDVIFAEPVGTIITSASGISAYEGRCRRFRRQHFGCDQLVVDIVIWCDLLSPHQGAAELYQPGAICMNLA